jgi:lipopolysaccharide biosynthesis regulator YciM
MTPLGEAFEELVVGLQYGFEADAPREVDGRGVGVLRRMVGYRVAELVDLRARNCGHSSYVVDW